MSVTVNEHHHARPSTQGADLEVDRRRRRCSTSVNHVVRLDRRAVPTSCVLALGRWLRRGGSARRSPWPARLGAAAGLGRRGRVGLGCVGRGLPTVGRVVDVRWIHWTATPKDSTKQTADGEDADAGGHSLGQRLPKNRISTNDAAMTAGMIQAWSKNQRRVIPSARRQPFIRSTSSMSMLRRLR